MDCDRFDGQLCTISVAKCFECVFSEFILYSLKRKQAINYLVALRSGFREHYGRFGAGPRAWHGAHAMRMWQQLGAVASHRRQAMAAREFLKQRQILSFWSRGCLQLSQRCIFLLFITQIKRMCVNFATLSFPSMVSQLQLQLPATAISG